MHADDNGWVAITDDCADNVFYNDADASTRAWARSRLRAMRGGTADVVTLATRPALPTTYLLTTDDRAVLPSWQRAMSRRCTDVIEVPTGHSTFAVAPELLARHLVTFARNET